MQADPLTLRPYQVEDLAFHLANPKSLNLSDPGTGKTPTVCMLSYFCWKREHKKTLWVMPKSLLIKNRDEMLRFTGFEEADVVILESDFAPLTKNWTGPTFTRQKRVKENLWRVVDPKTNTLHRVGKVIGSSELDGNMLVEEHCGPGGVQQTRPNYVPEVAKDIIADAKDAKVFIASFAFLASHWKRLFEAAPDIDLFLVDELHMGFGGPQSAQTESFFWVNRKVRRFVGMTGTLVNGRLDSAYPAIHAIEPRYYGSHMGFLVEHSLIRDDYGRTLVWTKEDRLRQIIESHSIKHSFTDVYGEEPVVFFTEQVPIGPKCREEYDKFHAQAMLELENGEILDGTLPGVNLIRARQIMAHPETMLIAKGEKTGKDERLEIFATEGQPMLIFAALKPEQVRIAELMRKCGLRTGLINSDVSATKRAQIDQQFQNGDLDVIVASGPTAAVGYNWERADHVVFASIDYMDVNILQAYRRASRGTRTKTLRVTFMQYADSIDQRQYQIVKTKSELANRVDPSRRVITA